MLLRIFFVILHVVTGCMESYVGINSVVDPNLEVVAIAVSRIS